MTETGGPGAALAGQASRQASALPVVVLCLLLAARLTDVLTAGPADPAGQVLFTVALLVLPLLYAVPSTRPLVWRYRWLALVVQGALTWVPFALFGGSWQTGIGGLLAGLVLLMLPGRASWLLAGMLLAAEVAVRTALTGLPAEPAWFGLSYTVVYYVDDALSFFAVVRLAQIVGEVEQARTAAAGLAVARERLQAAEELQAAIGERLSGIASMVAAAQRALPGDTAEAAARAAAAGAAAREAVAQAREVATRHRGAPGQGPAAPRLDRAVIGARLAWAVLVTVLLMFTVQAVGFPFYLRYDARLATLVAVAAVLAAAMQLYHSRAARRGGRARAWPVTLAVQAMLVYVFLFPFVRVLIVDLAPFLAGSILLLVRGWWRWAGYAAVAVTWSVLIAVVPLRGNPIHHPVPYALTGAAAIAGIGLVVYGLAWLTGLATQLEAMQGDLARVAVVGERLRIARDVHDLLGLGLTAIALKADLAGQLIGRDDGRAVAELAELGRVCASARADIRVVTGGGQRMSLAGELTAARQILASAGVQVRADVPARPLPDDADGVLATVLREAVTNILRHSAATACTIEARPHDGVVRLRVTNDGVPGPSAGAGGSGSGLANLTTRLQAAGGCLTSSHADGRFDLTAEIPLASPPG